MSVKFLTGLERSPAAVIYATNSPALVFPKICGLKANHTIRAIAQAITT